MVVLTKINVVSASPYSLNMRTFSFKDCRSSVHAFMYTFVFSYPLLSMHGKTFEKCQSLETWFLLKLKAIRLSINKFDQYVNLSGVLHITKG